tara:strand:- start:1249 stop:1770 length:522 start_codon:yes stop_codon:yes gene_type:complete
MAFNIQDVIYQWETLGVFDYLLPFLLIFAIVFGVLRATHIMGDNRGVMVVIAGVVGLLALRIGIVQVFFTELFPRFAIGLAILVVIIILVGLFINPEEGKPWFIGLGILGALIGVAVVIGTFDTFGWFNSFFWQENWGLVIGGIILLLLILFMAIGPVGGGSKGIKVQIPKFR